MLQVNLFVDNAFMCVRENNFQIRLFSFLEHNKYSMMCIDFQCFNHWLDERTLEQWSAELNWRCC